MKEVKQCPVDQSHGISQKVERPSILDSMKNLRGNPTDAAKNITAQWKAFYTQKGKPEQEANYLASQKETAAIEGVILHAGWNKLMERDLIPRLQAEKSLVADMHKWHDTYYGFRYQNVMYDTFLSAMVHWQKRAFEHFYQEFATELIGSRKKSEHPHPDYYLWNEFTNSLARRSQAKYVWDRFRDPSNAPSKPTSTYARAALNTIELETSHNVMELLLYTKLAQDDPNIDPDVMTRKAFEAIPTLTLAAHVTGKKASEANTPWSIAFARREPMGDPVTVFKRNPVLVVEDGKYRFTHPSLKDGVVKADGDCTGRWPMASVDTSEHNTPQAFIDLVKKSIGGELPNISLGKKKGEFDVTTIQLAAGTLIARDTFFKRGW